MNTDERGHWTSASNAQPDALCPGRFRAQLGMPELPEQQATTSGVKIHQWLSGKPVELTPNELETAETIRDACDVILREQFPNGCHIEFENRLWMRLGSKLHSGEPDLLAHITRTVLILDYKTGWGFVPQSESNMQLRDLAVLAWDALKPETVRVGKIQPGASGTPYLCEYTAEELERAKFEMLHRIEACHQEDAPRIPGPVQCQYCRFRPKCPEAQATVTAIEPVTNVHGALLDGLTISRLLDAGLVAEKIIDENKDLARKLLTENPDAIPGWTLKKGACVRDITDPETVASRFVKLGGDVQQFMRAVKVSIGQLEKLLREAKNYKGRDLENAVNLLIDGCYQEKQNSPSLKRT